MSADEKRYMTPHKPCAECPFRTDSTRGWFGPYNATYYMEAAMSEARTQCHMTSKKPDGQQRHCTGIALFRRKVLKEPRDPVGQAHQDACVEKYSTNGILDYRGFRVWHHMDKPK